MIYLDIAKLKGSIQHSFGHDNHGASDLPHTTELDSCRSNFRFYHHVDILDSERRPGRDDFAIWPKVACRIEPCRVSRRQLTFRPINNSRRLLGCREDKPHALQVGGSRTTVPTLSFSGNTPYKIERVLLIVETTPGTT
jgi:hypothetical protein